METQTLTPAALIHINPFNKEEQIKTLVEWAYKTNSIMERRVRVPMVSKKTGLPIWKLYKLACQWGFAIPGERCRRWQPQELDILERYAHLQAPKIAKKLESAGFKRSTIAVEAKRKDLELGIRQSRLDAGVYSAEELAKLMGVSNRTIKEWIGKGYIKAKKVGSQWEVRNHAIKEFVKTHPLRFGLSTVNQLWFLDLILNTNADKA